MGSELTVNDEGILALALLTLGGLAMLIVGWQARAIVEAGRYRRHYSRDETDEAGA